MLLRIRVVWLGTTWSFFFLVDIVSTPPLACVHYLTHPSAAAAVLRPHKHVARAPARGAGPSTELSEAHRDEVRRAPGRGAQHRPGGASAGGGLHQHGEVVAIHEADVAEWLREADDCRAPNRDATTWAHELHSW